MLPSDSRNTILLLDYDEPLLRPLCRFRSPFSLRNGIYTAAERIRILHPGCELYYSHPDEEYELMISQIEGYLPARTAPEGDRESYFSERITSREVNLLELLDQVEERVESDLFLLLKHSDRYTNPSSSLLPGVSLVGSQEDIWLHNGCRILPGSVIDSREGPVIVDEGAEISPFSYLQGPLYVGRDSLVDDARITGGTILGHRVRVGGEIENSVFNDCTNKHHEGFVGHSLLGSWVNLGALTTTSDLKNNYGEIRLILPTDFLPPADTVPSTVSHPTGRIKFGSLVGDHVKTAIGTLLNTGTVVDAGSNLFSGAPGKYVPPFSWGISGEKYDRNRFLSDARKIMARRKREPHPLFERMVDRLFAS